MEFRDLVNTIDEKLSRNDDESSMELKDLVKILEGRLVGNDEYFSIDGFTGKFTFLNDAHTGDIVVRDWVDEKGIAIAFKKNAACFITKNPKNCAVEMAEKLSFPLIITDKLELAKSHVLANRDKRFARDISKIENLVKAVDGKLVGNDEYFSIDGFSGRFTFLNDAHTGDIVIRHWINGKGIEMAFDKNIACLITQTPKDCAVEMAEKLSFPLIITDKIELANAVALSNTIDKYSPFSTNVVITGTNGKSTTSHLIYHILNNAGYHVLTNTDSESEFNTLIDPMVSKLISDEVTKNCELDYIVVEVSEVQGWLGKLMKNHAALMTEAIRPRVGVITNIAMDHIGLVNSIDDVFREISTVPDAIGDGVCVVNFDDDLVMKLNVRNPFYTSMSELNDENAVYYNGLGIVYDNQTILTNDELPFTGHHFIQNILSAVGAAISLGLDIHVIEEGVKSYKALNRRFAKLNDEPLIYDDFAHNPDGIRATISETKKLLPDNQTLYVVCAIRGSRGVEINQLNVEALVESMDDSIELILSSSNDVVNDLNFVEEDEREVFFNTLNENNVEFIHYDNLKECLSDTYNKADKKDIILLIGAQGMDPAESLLKDII